jgi:hypothetical protein
LACVSQVSPHGLLLWQHFGQLSLPEAQGTHMFEHPNILRLLALYSPSIVLALAALIVGLWPANKTASSQSKSGREITDLRNQIIERGKKRLHTLDRKEKLFLGRQVQNNSRSGYTEVYNATALGLRECGIIRWAARTVPVDRAPFVIEDWAWDELHEHPEVLEIEGGHRLSDLG